MPAQPTYTKTVRLAADLHQRLIALGEPNFSAYIARLVAEDVTSREMAIDVEKADHLGRNGA